MRYAVLSDIHANAEAFLTVLDYLQKENITRIICLGDVIGYGPRPNECVQLVRDRCDVVLMGNHDHAALGLTDIYYFNQYAKDAILWTRKSLDAGHKSYIESLPFTHEEGKLLFVHSTPIEPEHWHYVFSDQDARENLDAVSHRLVFIGHSHVPIIFSYRKGSFKPKTMRCDLDNDRYIVNVGSVGQPRDADPRACFVIFNDEEWEIEYVRLEYPVEKTYQQIIEHQLPPFLAMRLLAGQ